MYDIEHSQDSETRRVDESDDASGGGKGRSTMTGRSRRVITPGCTNNPARVLERKYPLTKTGYKFLNVCVTLERSSRVNIILGDSHSKEVSMSPDMWRQLLKQRHVLSKYLQSTNGEPSFPAPSHIGNMTVYWNMNVYWNMTFRKNQQLDDITPGNVRGSLGHVEGNSE
ncbi:hypothetical protein P5V15_002680 [Pogonomyrmex californicus]